MLPTDREGYHLRGWERCPEKMDLSEISFFRNAEFGFFMLLVLAFSVA